MIVLPPKNQSFCFVLPTRQDDLIFIPASLFFKLRITNYELRITNYELRITNYELPITHYPLPIPYYPLPITHYPFPITHYPLINRIPLLT
ncbi:MAG: hypothetical protein ACRC2M_19320, partial [Planktothrix sp.]